jgi:hypothetical protein
MSLIRRRKKELVEAVSTTPILKVEDLVPEDLFPPYEIYSPLDYRDGPEGFISWAEENVCIPIYPEGSDIPSWISIGNLPTEKNLKTNRSYSDMWESKKAVYRNALRMVNGRFRYRLIVLCWMRGEGKSLDACLIQLWKFMNWPRQMIVLGANSKDQIKFVHYDIIRDIVLNSPKILSTIGKKNVQEKEIRMRDEKGNIGSRIMPITSFSGIVSNITGYTFSEIFAMKNPKFFVELDGSTRNIPNALGVIDSTVSAKNHILYSLFNNYKKGEAKSLYFDYRFSRKGLSEDYWNPNMDQGQLDDYRAKFPLGDYERFFLNTWGSGSSRAFTDEMVEAIRYIGCDGLIGNHSIILDLIKQKNEILEASGDNLSSQELVKSIDLRFRHVSDVYSLTSILGTPESASIDDLIKLGDIYDTDWVVLCGTDRADPMKGSRSGARTIFICIAKGLPGSRSRPWIPEGTAPNYLYVVLSLVIIPTHSLEDIKDNIVNCHAEYDGVDCVCGERWGIWDLEKWCEELQIKFETTYPSYDRQRAAFSEVFNAVSTGRFKSPPSPIWGSKEVDILKEELSIFYHDADKRWFGSPEKDEKYGIQDDVVFSLGWCLYGGREMSIDSFRSRNKKMWFGTFLPERNRLTA